MDYRKGEQLRIFLRRKVPGQSVTPQMPEEIVTATVTGVEAKGQACTVEQNGRVGRLADEMLTFYDPPAEQWVVLGVVRA